MKARILLGLMFLATLVKAQDDRYTHVFSAEVSEPSTNQNQTANGGSTSVPTTFVSTQGGSQSAYQSSYSNQKYFYYKDSTGEQITEENCGEQADGFVLIKKYKNGKLIERLHVKNETYVTYIDNIVEKNCDYSFGQTYVENPVYYNNSRPTYYRDYNNYNTYNSGAGFGFSAGFAVQSSPIFYERPFEKPLNLCNNPKPRGNNGNGYYLNNDNYIDPGQQQDNPRPKNNVMGGNLHGNNLAGGNPRGGNMNGGNPRGGNVMGNTNPRGNMNNGNPRGGVSSFGSYSNGGSSVMSGNIASNMGRRR